MIWLVTREKMVLREGSSGILSFRQHHCLLGNGIQVESSRRTVFRRQNGDEVLEFSTSEK